MVARDMVKRGMAFILISGGYASIRNSILPRPAALLTIRIKSMEKNNA
jgi:hypothetical protein